MTLTQLKSAFEALDPNYWRSLAQEALSEEGVDAEAVAQDLADALDAALNFAILLPAPWGPLVESFDGIIAQRIIAKVLEDIESPEERKAFGKKLKAARTQRRRRRGAKAHPTISKIGTPGQGTP